MGLPAILSGAKDLLHWQRVEILRFAPDDMIALCANHRDDE